MYLSWKCCGMGCRHVCLQWRFKCIFVLLLQAAVKARSTRATKNPTIELALFFDAAGYQLFAPYFSGDDAKLRDMLLAYMNGVWYEAQRENILFSSIFPCFYIIIMFRYIRSDLLSK
jgi:hypothetical protein